MEKEFEEFWKRNQQMLIERAPQHLKDERANTGKMNTAGDWILFIVPVAMMIIFTDHGFFRNEMVNFIVGVLIGIVGFALSMFVKPYVTGKRNVVDIDADIKQHFYQIYKNKGLDSLK